MSIVRKVYILGCIYNLMEDRFDVLEEGNCSGPIIGIKSATIFDEVINVGVSIDFVLYSNGVRRVAEKIGN